MMSFFFKNSGSRLLIFVVRLADEMLGLSINC